MKRVVFLLGILALVTISVSSCASMKRDCRGNKHYRLENGIYL